MTQRYVRTLSWHLSRADGRTLCGRVPSTAAERSDDLPLNAKSCETCLRLAAHKADAELITPVATVEP